jgi:hypothetical protein
MQMMETNQERQQQLTQEELETTIMILQMGWKLIPEEVREPMPLLKMNEEKHQQLTQE